MPRVKKKTPSVNQRNIEHLDEVQKAVASCSLACSLASCSDATRRSSLAAALWRHLRVGAPVVYRPLLHLCRAGSCARNRREGDGFPR